MAKNEKKSIPFSFVLDELYALKPAVKPMFGCHAVYIGEKIVLILRDKVTPVLDNGVWVATTVEHHESLKAELPSLRSIDVFGGGVTGWQCLPVSAPDFEASVQKVCALILERDPRVGKLPGAKSKAKAKAKAKGARRTPVKAKARAIAKAKPKRKPKRK